MLVCKHKALINILLCSLFLCLPLVKIILVFSEKSLKVYYEAESYKQLNGTCKNKRTYIYQQSQQQKKRDITHHIASGWFWQPSLFLNNIKIDKFVLLHSLHQKQQALKMVSLKNNKHRLTRG